MKTPILEVRGIFKSFKDVKAVNGIDLAFYGGEYTALLGPNGAGKTTLIEMIEGIQTPDKCEILIKDKKWSTHKQELNRILGISLQETRFIEKLTVLETLELFASFYNLKRDRINEILKLINLEEKKKAFVVNLSGGQRQRLTLGIALLNRPEILLLDEPTTGLDPTARREIWNILMNLKKELGTTLILTTHYMEEAEFLCDRIVIMDKGAILVDATLEKLLQEYTKGEVIQFAIEQPLANSKLPEISAKYELISNENQKYELMVDKASDFLPHFFEMLKLENLSITTIESRKKTLDDLFISMTGRHLE